MPYNEKFYLYIYILKVIVYVTFVGLTNYPCIYIFYMYSEIAIH